MLGSGAAWGWFRAVWGRAGSGLDPNGLRHISFTHPSVQVVYQVMDAAGARRGVWRGRCLYSRLTEGGAAAGARRSGTPDEHFLLARDVEVILSHSVAFSRGGNRSGICPGAASAAASGDRRRRVLLPLSLLEHCLRIATSNEFVLLLWFQYSNHWFAPMDLAAGFVSRRGVWAVAL